MTLPSKQAKIHVRTARCRLCRSIRSLLWLSGEWRRHDCQQQFGGHEPTSLHYDFRFVREIILLSAATKQWIDDNSRFKIAVKSRHIGLTFAAALEIAFASAGDVAVWASRLLARRRMPRQNRIGRQKPAVIDRRYRTLTARCRRSLGLRRCFPCLCIWRLEDKGTAGAYDPPFRRCCATR
jgi:hypothetical protein